MLSNMNNLQTALWIQVLLSNTNNYMISSSCFYLINLHTFIWPQLTNNNL